MDEVQLDKSGDYFIIATRTSGFVLDLQSTAPAVEITNSPTGHGDLGEGILVGYESATGNSLSKRTLATPNATPTPLLNMATVLGRDYQQSLHLSLRGKFDTWALLGFYPDYTPLPGTGKFDGELVLVKTDGTGEFRRIAHHHSVFGFSNGTNYWGSPRANLNHDMKFAAFSSNWGAPNGFNSQVDLFIARLGDAFTAATTNARPDPTPGPLPSPWAVHGIRYPDDDTKPGAACRWRLPRQERRGPTCTHASRMRH